MLQRWNDMDLYHELLKKNEGKPRFALHDGPPFSNGNLHMGHALNKSIKDFITRIVRHAGPLYPLHPRLGQPRHAHRVRHHQGAEAQPQGDERGRVPHRLPQATPRTTSTSRWRASSAWACWATGSTPIRPWTPALRPRRSRSSARCTDKGYIYKGLKPVYWCPHDETALAEAEIEYQDDPCTTVYVKFPVHRTTRASLSQYGDLSKHVLRHLDHHHLDPARQPGHLPSTPSESYVLVKARQRRGLYRGRGPGAKVMQGGAALTDYEIVGAAHAASDFEYMTGPAPLPGPGDRHLCCADYVTMDSGTGCVHTAPGFGADDFEICQQYDKAGRWSHVGMTSGRHTDYAGKSRPA